MRLYYCTFVCISEINKNLGNAENMIMILREGIRPTKVLNIQKVDAVYEVSPKHSMSTM
jgi:hypothetical protein